MVALLDPLWLQGAFITLLGMFVRLSMNTNVGKTVGMICHPCQVVGTQLDAAYERRMTDAGHSYREKQHVWVRCT